MSGLFGAIGRGLSAAGYAAGDLYGKQALMEAQSGMEEERAKRLAEFRNQMELENIPKQAKATAEAELANAPTKAQAKSLAARAAAEDELATAPTKAKAKVAGEYSPELVEARGREEERKLRMKATIEREETAAAGNDPKYLAAVRRLSQAKHVEGLGSVAQAELANMGIAEKKKAIALFERFETTTDPAEKAKIKESLMVRGLIKSSEYDTEKVTEERINEDGSTTKTERTQRRGAGAAAPAAKPKLAVGTEVDGYVFQGGNPNDQSSWVLKGRTSGGKVK